jgi:hypothetical protein
MLSYSDCSAKLTKGEILPLQLAVTYCILGLPPMNTRFYRLDKKERNNYTTFYIGWK